MNKPTIAAGVVALIFAGLHLPGVAGDMVALDFSAVDKGDVRSIRLLVSDAYVVTLDPDGRVQSRYSLQDQELLVIDHQQMTAIRVNEAAATEMAAELNQGLSEILADIESLPADQQEKSLAGLRRLFHPEGPSSGESATELTPTDEFAKFAGIACRWYRYRDHESVGRACLAETTDVPGGTQLLAMLETLSGFYDILESGQGGRFKLPIPQNPLAPMARLGKVAVKVTEQVAGMTPSLDVELLATQRGAIDQALFELPDGLNML
jgi:hypothetical protein